MSKKVFRTVAFQIDDWDFLTEYDKRQQESGLSVKNYFISLIKADIAMHQTQDNSPAQEGGSTDEAFEPEEETASEELAEQPDEAAASENTDEAYTAAPFSKYGQRAAFVQDEEMMNLFVKIPKEQREALEALKTATGETAGAILNRLIDDFLDHTDSLPEGFEEAYQRYAADIKSCDTTWSAKIPSRVNQELTDYLNEFGGSRNALMASLVELELKEQEMTQDEDQDAGIQQM
jgi:hypothetical protein